MASPLVGPLKLCFSIKAAVHTGPRCLVCGLIAPGPRVRCDNLRHTLHCLDEPTQVAWRSGGKRPISKDPLHWSSSDSATSFETDGEAHAGAKEESTKGWYARPIQAPSKQCTWSKDAVLGNRLKSTGTPEILTKIGVFV